jgi:hypothetical protein
MLQRAGMEFHAFWGRDFIVIKLDIMLIIEQSL